MRLKLHITVMYGADTEATLDLDDIGISAKYFRSLTRREKEQVLDRYITEYVYVDSFEELE